MALTSSFTAGPCLCTKQCQRSVKASATPRQGARESKDASHNRRAILGLIPLSVCLPAAANTIAPVQPFLKSTGVSGILADEEEMLLSMRKDAESKARAGLDAERDLLTKEFTENQSGLCASPFGVDIVGITEFIALVGALVGGLTARSRKLEAERLNEQLRKINLQLRQQARAGTIYAPGLSYAPVSNGPTSSKLSVPIGGASGTATAVRQAPPVPMTSMDEPISPEQENCRETMREGKRLLRSNQGAAALVRFEKASLMSRKLGDMMLERRALRGMAASSRMQGNLQAAIKHLAAVLQLSTKMQDFTGDADAYGSIADIYADLGEFEKAAVYYDKYINRMQEDDVAA